MVKIKNIGLIALLLAGCGNNLTPINVYNARDIAQQEITSNHFEILDQHLSGIQRAFEDECSVRYSMHELDWGNSLDSINDIREDKLRENGVLVKRHPSSGTRYTDLPFNGQIFAEDFKGTQGYVFPRCDNGEVIYYMN